MLIRLLRSAALAAAAAIAVACATTATAPKQAIPADTANLPGTPACFWLRNVWGWTVLNNSELIVQAPTDRNAYLVKLFAPVFDLDYRVGLGFRSVEHTGLICGPSRDYLIVRGYAPPRMPIVAVQRLTAAEQVQLLQAAKRPVPRGLLPPATPPAPPPPPTPPARATPT
jgi:hypothetical protein